MRKSIIFERSPGVYASASFNPDEKRWTDETDAEVCARVADTVTDGPWFVIDETAEPKAASDFWIVDFAAETITVDAAAANAADAERKELSVKAECRRRIFAVADDTTQMNISAVTALIGTGGAAYMSEKEKADHITAHEAGLVWIANMRTAWPTIVDQGLDLADDKNWPVCPPAVMALAKKC